MRSRHALDHAVSRRAFFGAAGGVAGLGAFATPLMGEELLRKDRRVLMIFLHGGLSQFESWDPKPGRPTGGPFQAIQTSVPGYHMCELMPKMAASISRHTAVIRSLDVKNMDHKEDPLFAGRLAVGGLKMPSIGAMLARELGDPASPLPHSVTLGSWLGSVWPDRGGFYGSRWDPIIVRGHLTTPENVDLPPGMTDAEHRGRDSLRGRLAAEFIRGRERNAVLTGHDASFGRVRGIMDQAAMFDIDREPQKIRDAYGPTHFGKHALTARRLIEAGVPYVRVNYGYWDHHSHTFENHQDMVPELDHVMSTLLDDLATRGLLDHTLVATLSEVSRSPKINCQMGRDHWSKMSVSLSGCGIRPGVIHGETNADGTDISKDVVSLDEFFATIFRAVGVDHLKEHIAPDGRPVPLTLYDTKPVAAVLA